MDSGPSHEMYVHSFADQDEPVHPPNSNFKTQVFYMLPKSEKMLDAGSSLSE